jgi:hypothetical protein
MKKLFAAIIAGALLSFGLVATTTTTASAACPYTACTATASAIKTKPKVQLGRKGKVLFRTVSLGNVPPSGSVLITIKRKGGGFTVTRQISYTGGTVRLNTKKLRRLGTYTVRAVFSPPPNSIFLSSAATSTFKVKRARRS